MIRIWHIGLSLVALTMGAVAWAQPTNYPLHFELHNQHDRFELQSNDIIHTGIRPMNRQFTKETVEPVYNDSIKVYSKVGQKFFKHHFVDIKGPDYHLYVDPLLQIEVGMDLADTSGRGSLSDKGGTFYLNTRGIQAGGHIGPKMSFHTAFYENQAFFPDYLRLHNLSRGEYFWTGSKYDQQFSRVPGMGRAKAFKKTGFDYAMAIGHIAYAPTPYLNLQFGHGKHFFGHGYRSLLLSDNAFAYPYWQAQAQTKNGKIHYSFLYTYMQNLYRLPEHSAPEASFVRKNGTFHYLSFKPGPGTEIGLFEGVVWQVYDSLSGSQPAPVLSYNPVVGVNTAVLGLNHEWHNAVLGINAKQRLSKKGLMYGQVMLDDLANQRFGFQLGLKWFDLFKIPNLVFTIEANHVTKYSYAHNHIWQNYAHYNDELAHPYGAGFTELVTYARYEHKWRFWGSYKLNLAILTGTWNDRNNGSDVFLPYNSSLEPNGDQSFLQFHQIRLGYRANVKTNLNIYFSMNFRHFSDDEQHLSNYLSVGITTGLINRYFDR